MKARKLVGTNNQGEFPVGIFLLQPGKGINGVGGFGHFKLNVTHPEPGFIFNSQFYQCISVMIC